MMWTGVYWPKDAPCGVADGFIMYTTRNQSNLLNNASWLNGPSYCVRLLVFDYDYDDG